MESPVEPPHVPTTGLLKQSAYPRTTRYGWIALVVAFLGMVIAIMGPNILKVQKPDSRDSASIESGNGKSKGAGYHFTIKIGEKKAVFGKEPATERAKEPVKVSKKGLKDWFFKKDPELVNPPLEVTAATAPVPATDPAKTLEPVPPIASDAMTVANTSTANFWPRFVEFAPIVAGLLGVALGLASWILREDHRVSGSALTVAGIAICWQWIALGVAIGVGCAILIAILPHIS